MNLQKSMPSRIRLLVPVVYSAGLFFVSSIPGRMTQEDDPWHAWLVYLSPLAQNILHVPAFAGLAWSWAWALQGWLTRQSARLALAFLFAALYAALDEWHQSFVPGRTSSLADFVLDFTGAFLGVLVASRTSGGPQS